MNCNRSLLIVSVLVFATPVLAQQHKPAGVRPGGGGTHPGAIHPGQQHPGMMSSEQQMMHEFYMQQMMLNEMMGPRRGGRSHVQGQTAAGQNQSGGNPRSQSGNSVQAKAAHTGSLGSNPQQANPSSGTKSKHDAAAAKEAHREKERAKEKLNESKVATANRSTRSADNGTISLLRTEHARLHRADADYQGHRVRAMNHIESAIRHLGSTSGLNMGLGGGYNAGTGLGGGNLPQAESDQIVRDAIFHLSQTQASLGTGTNAAAHHRNAHTSVMEAIHELQVALKIR
jgi:hypothetical protein